jgi:hypothetical protein
MWGERVKGGTGTARVTCEGLVPTDSVVELTARSIAVDEASVYDNGRDFFEHRTRQGGVTILVVGIFGWAGPTICASVYRTFA